MPPSTAAIASIVVRMTLLYGSCSVSDTPEVWQWVRSIFDCSVLRAEPVHDPVPEHARGAQLRHLHEEVHADAEEEAEPRREGVDVEPLGAAPRATYSMPSARVKASSCTAVAPASCM